jgi:[acyl-carrier-protein] S-malonyltransferase
LRAVRANDPCIPVIANVDAEPKRDAAAAIEALIKQIASPVRWEDVVRRLIAEGARQFVELGPGTVLSGLVQKIDPTVTAMSIEDPDAFEAALPQLRS